MKTTHGLREQIAKATNFSEIDSLLKKCEIYKDASTETKKRWINTAKKRAQEIEAADKESVDKTKKGKKKDK